MVYAVLIVSAVLAGIIAYVAWSSEPDSGTPWNDILTSRQAKYAAVAGLALALMAPLWLVKEIVSVREADYRSAHKSVGEIWGARQSVIGPMLIVPYEYRPDDASDPSAKSARDKKRTAQGLAVFLPDELNLKSIIDPVIRRQGIHEFPVYRSKLYVSGQFGRPDFAQLPHRPSRVDWQGAYLSFGLGDTRAITGPAQFRWNDREVDLQQGMRYLNFQSSGLHAMLPKLSSDRKSYAFSLTMEFKGSDALVFAPLGRMTTAAIQSRWRSLSFLGVLPVSQSAPNKEFSAEWRIPHLARHFPQQWIVGQEAAYLTEIRGIETGVGISEPNGFYQTVRRALAFGIIPIGLVFAAFAFFEVMFGARIGIFQYVITGGALCLFYLLVVALSEHVGFPIAYVWSSALAIIAVCAYSAFALARISLAVVCFALLTGTYSSLFVLLRQPDYGLVFTAGLLLAAVAGAMCITRAPADPPSEAKEAVARPVRDSAVAAAAAGQRAYESVFENAFSRILGGDRGQGAGRGREKPDFRAMTDTLLRRRREDTAPPDASDDEATNPEGLREEPGAPS